MSYTVLERADLAADGMGNVEFEGYRYGGPRVSFIRVDMRPGDGVRLHKHPYEEVFIILSGNATYTAGDETIKAHGGQVIIVSAETPHKFINSGTEQLRQIDIHANDRFITDWLED